MNDGTVGTVVFLVVVGGVVLVTGGLGVVVGLSQVSGFGQAGQISFSGQDLASNLEHSFFSHFN